MASSKSKSWEELEQKLAGKKLVFWGASNWVERTMNKLTVPPAYIIDKNKVNQGIEHCGYVPNYNSASRVLLGEKNAHSIWLYII